MKGKTIITVIGADSIGIIAAVTGVLAEHSVNILDINQTIMQDFFTMIMLCDLSTSDIELSVLQDELEGVGKEKQVQIQAQHEDIFTYMHRV